MKVRPRKNDFKENRVSSLNKLTWTLSLELHVNVNLAQNFNLASNIRENKVILVLPFYVRPKYPSDPDGVT